MAHFNSKSYKTSSAYLLQPSKQLNTACYKHKKVFVYNSNSIETLSTAVIYIIAIAGLALLVS